MHTDPKPSNNQETLESIKNRFSNKLTAILYEKLTVENIETFADDALDQAVALTNEIMEYYYNSDDINPDLEFKDQEDDAYEKLGLPKISNILDRIEEKKNEIDAIKDKIKKEYTDTIITPPQENDGGIIPGDGNGFEKKKLLPRLLTLMYILENDLEVDLENVKITEGKVHDNMMRQTPYVRVEIDDLERLVYICDEEGNASYIFDTEKLKEKRITPEELDIDNKGDKNSLIYHYPGIGMRVIQIKNWRDRIKTLLENEIPVIDEEKNPLGEVEEFESEFKKREKRIILPYEQWIQELKTAYEQDKDFEGNFRDWYIRQAKQHEGWPRDTLTIISRRYDVTVDDIYRDIGYKKRTLHQENMLTYEQWIQELKEVYEQDKDFEGSFSVWYLNKAKNHRNWPRDNLTIITRRYGITMNDIYHALRYERKMPRQEFILTYGEWVEELKEAYEKDKDFEGNFESWYKTISKQHKGWPRGSIVNILDKYGISANELYNKINYKKKRRMSEDILPYEKWIEELKNAYEQDRDFEGSFKNWYMRQSKIHTKWRREPITRVAEKYNKTAGDIYHAIGYNRKTLHQEVILTYSKWIQELKEAYEQDKDFEGNFKDWYIKQAKQHEGWPRETLTIISRRYGVRMDDVYRTIGYKRKINQHIITSPQTPPGPTH